MQINDASGAVHTLPTKINLGSKASGALQTASENSERTACTESVAAREAMTSALSQTASFEKGHGKSAAAGQQDMTSSQASFLQSYNEAQKIAHNYASGHGLSQKQEAELLASAGADASGGINIFGNGATVSAGATVKGKSSSGTTQMQNVAHQLAQDKGFTNAISTMRNAAHQDTFTQGEDKTAKAAQGIRSSFDQAKSHDESAQAAHEKSLTFKEAASRTKEMAGNYDANYTNEFVGWMQTQSDRTGHRYTVDDVTDMALHDKGVLEQYADRFVSEQLVPKIDQAIEKPTNNVAGGYEQNKAAVPGTEAVSHSHNRNDARVMGAARSAGVDPNTAPVNQVAGQVQKMTGQANDRIKVGRGAVTKEGKPLEQDATKFTDPARQNNMSLATQNATATIMPAGTMSLLNKAGLVSDEAGVAKPVAEGYKGSTTDAIVDTALDVGLTVGGGVAGRFVGKAAGKILGESAGKAAEGKMLANATKVEERGLAAGKVETHAAADTRRTAERESARKAGVNREAEVNATHAVAGTVVGAVATNQALDAVKEGVNKANDLGNQIGDKAKRVFKD
jgi:conjugal transfer mating pair stabilization protein TraG